MHPNRLYANRLQGLFSGCTPRLLFCSSFIICQGLTKYNNGSAAISDSVFHPKQLTENRMLYFWLSGQSFLSCGHCVMCCIITPLASMSSLLHLRANYHLSLARREVF